MTTDPTASDRIDALARRLADARSNGTPLDPPPAELVPADQAEAEQVDDRVAAVLGVPVAGWKIGCTSDASQQLMGAAGPFAGRVFSVFDSGTTLGSDELMVDPRIEGEFAFTLAVDLPPRPEPRPVAELAAAMADVRPAIEVVGGRYRDFLAAPLTAIIADAGANSHLLLGPPAPVPPPEELEATAARMEIDGATAGSGTGADVLGGPMRALAWLAANLSDRGITLAEGQVVTTGTATGVTALSAGATATVTLDGIGSATVQRTA
jgi:2-oxo-3-hexenedioate decarboxylase/2-keto-4-pentenoate hydratase